MPQKHLQEIINDFAKAFKEIDSRELSEKAYKPGIGPFGEDRAVGDALAYLKEKDTYYESAYTTKRCPDLMVPSHWAIEFKLMRPHGDNGAVGEFWSKKILYPYPGSTSAIGDCFKLINSGLQERKGIIIIGYEHAPPKIDLTITARAFEAIAKEVLGIQMSDRCTAEFTDLIHPVHQTGKLFGWEIFGLSPQSQTSA